MASALAAAQSSFDLKSPDKRIEVRIRTAQRHSLRRRSERPRDSRRQYAFDRRRSQEYLARTTRRSCTRKRRRHDEIARAGRAPEIRKDSRPLQRRAHSRSMAATPSPFAPTTKASLTGFETSLPAAGSEDLRRRNESEFFANDIVYYPQEDGFMSHNERKYLPQHLSEILPEFIATLPAVVDVGQGAKRRGRRIRCRGISRVCGCGEPADRARRNISAVSVEGDTRERTRTFRVTEAADYIAVTKGTRTYPWRVLGIVDQDRDLLTNSDRVAARKAVAGCGHVVDQAGQSRVGLVERATTFTAWISKRASTPTTYKYYIDFAAKYADSLHHSRRRLVQARQYSGGRSGNQHGRTGGLRETEKRRPHSLGGVEGRSTKSSSRRSISSRNGA